MHDHADHRVPDDHAGHPGQRHPGQRDARRSQRDRGDDVREKQDEEMLMVSITEGIKLNGDTVASRTSKAG